MTSRRRGRLAPVLFLLAAAAPGAAQTARVSEEVRTLRTYPFSEPDPVPVLTRDPRLYPYHAFGGYAATSEPREWGVVKLENDHIEVFVLPEAGGKVWGAVVKATGHEFIYRNEVMKFRNIALRGPWTSGGIEFNFGVIGHTPATATPVDYLTVTNPDGSVSCWVGGMDLPSRTHWRVEVRLAPGRASFDTNVHWYNPTPLEQPYYNWMTAAAFARDDLEMSIPGDAYLRHSGREMAWPVDELGRYLPRYADNAFGGHKSYHVVGELNDFFGGYYHDEGYGFGHWARYEEMPGQKLWLWALSREGGVWEELLTDTDGQYVEFQAGRLFVQYQPGTDVNPITQAGFDPMSASRWSETWFPLEGTGGLTDASRDGAMHVGMEGDRLTVGVNAFRDVADTLRVWSGDRPVAAEPVALRTLEPYRAEFIVDAQLPHRVALGALDLEFSSDPAERRLARPFNTDPAAPRAIPEVDRNVFEARELMKGRRHGRARALFQAALAEEPWNREALLGMADLEYRAGAYPAGLEHVDRALQLDAYDARANFQAGLLYRALGRTADARDAFGWAARSTAFRAAAYAQLAEVMIGLGAWGEAARYARRSIEFDRHGVPGWRALAVTGRRSGDRALADEAARELLSIDPLHHFARAEAYLAAPTDPSARALLASLGGEYPHQILLELGVGYASLGLDDDARALLGLQLPAGRSGPGAGAPGAAPEPTASAPGAVIQAWRAWLERDPTRLAGPVDVAFQFPYRPETLPVLEWAAESSDHWAWAYLLALNLWAVGRESEAADRMRALGAEPDFAPVYAARAHLLSEHGGADPTPDLRRAVELDPSSRVLVVRLVRHLQDAGRWTDALAALDEAEGHVPTDFDLALLRARALVHTGEAREATEILATTRVLPSENARESHRLYEQAHTLVALDALEAGDHDIAREHLLAALEWPESLGQGRPYDPEERLVRFLLARTDELSGRGAGALEAYAAVVQATPNVAALADLDGLGERAPSAWRLDLLALPALAALGRHDELASVPWAARDTEGVGARLHARFPDLFHDLEGRMILRALSLAPSR